MKLRLVILSDLWGFNNLHWVNNYVKLLSDDFQLIFYDSCELAEIDKTNLTEKELHSKFTNGGIATAATNLSHLEKERVIVVGFSIGGTIAWKAGLSGLNISTLYAISSTRLRYETTKPNCKINLVYGAYDPYKPDRNWAEALKLKLEIIKNGEHDIYKNQEVFKEVCQQIKTQLPEA
ncbi:alpha/beta hydrolase [Aequorivita viscosa]|nr:alpha/beta hydrolase [Aequorivita viscosa]